MFKTYWSWLLIAGIGFVVVFLGRIPTIIGVTFLAIYAFKEFARASGLYRDSWMTGAVYAGIVTVGIAALISDPRGRESGPGWYGFFVTVPAFAIALILLIPILRNRARGELQRISLAIIGFIYIGWMFGHLGFMANAGNAYGFICYIIFATGLTDVAAFTFGKIFGHHPLRSEISPNKTWHRSEDPLRPQGGCRRVVDAGRPMDRRGRKRSRSYPAASHLQLPVDVQRLLRLRGGIYARVPGHRALQGPHRPSAEMDRGHRLQKQEGRGDRQRRHGGHFGAGDGA